MLISEMFRKVTALVLVLSLCLPAGNGVVFASGLNDSIAAVELEETEAEDFDSDVISEDSALPEEETEQVSVEEETNDMTVDEESVVSEDKATDDALDSAANEGIQEDSGHRKPEIMLDAEEFFIPGESYTFTVQSDMDGLLTVVDSASAEMYAEAMAISADEAVEITADEMPFAETVEFIITVRPENDDFSDLNALAVSGMEILTVYCDPDFNLETAEISILNTDSEDWTGVELISSGLNDQHTIQGSIPGPITISTVANEGKIDSGANQGHFYYREIESSAVDFRISATIALNSITATNNQSVAGFMLTDTLSGASVRPGTVVAGYNWASASTASAMITRVNEGSLSRTGNYSASEGSVLNVEMVKRGNTYYTYIDGALAFQTTGDFFHNDPTEPTLYLGLFVCRGVTATFSNIEFEILDASNTPAELIVTPELTSFGQNTEPDISGLAVEVRYESGSSVELSREAYTITDLSTEQIGDFEATVHYRGSSASFDYEVTPDQVVELVITIPPLYTSYAIGENFDPTGLEVSANMSSGEVKLLDPSEYTLTVPDMSTAGEKIIVISYEGKEIELIIVVKDITIEEISATNPRRTYYYVGEEAPETARELMMGSIVTVIYSDGSTKVLSYGDYTTNYEDYKDTFTQSNRNIDIILDYTGVTAAVTFEIKAVALEFLALTREYPKTTYFVGEALDLTGHTVVGVNNDGSYTEVLNENVDYRLDTSAFNAGVPGIYSIGIVGLNAYKGINGSFNVTVREYEDYTKGWEHVVFGQSASLSGNHLFMDEGEFGEIGPQTTVRLESPNGAGKIADGHDGINFYYRKLNPKDNFILTVDVELTYLGSANQANPNEIHAQSGFGVMLRDRIAEHGDTSIWSSSMMFAGARGNNQWRAFYRDNRSEYEDGITATNQVINFIDDGNTLPAFSPSGGQESNKATITIQRKNNNFSGSITVEGITRHFSYDNDIPLDYYDEDYIYVGFFTARYANAIFTNASLTVTDSASDPAGPELGQTSINPAVTIRSFRENAGNDYTLIYSTNVKGTANVYYNSQLIDSTEVPAYTIMKLPYTLDSSSNAFIVEFFPDIEEDCVSYEKIISSISVNVLNGMDKIYVSPNGGGDGTASISPMSFNEAVRFVKPGGEIILTEGAYGVLAIPKYNNGYTGAYKTVRAEGNVTTGNVTVAGDFWHVKGFVVEGANVRISGNDNVIEMLTVHSSMDTGVQISRSGDSNIYNHIDAWPSRNIILNCESYNHIDSAKENADGFAAKLTVGRGNKFIGCISHHNADDGWDLYAKSVPIGEVTIDSCISYRNGHGLHSTERLGNGNGYKLGGEGVPVRHVITNSIAFYNDMAGFSSNSNPYLIAHNNVSFDNSGQNLNLYSHSNVSERDFRVTEFYSYRKEVLINNPDRIEVIDENGSIVAGGEAPDVYLSDGTVSRNIYGREITDGFFVSLNAPIAPALRANNIGEKSTHFERDDSIMNQPGGNYQSSIILGDFLQLTDYARNHTGSAQTPNITSHPASVNVNQNSSVTLTVRANVSDGGTLSYQWYSNTTNSNRGGSPIAGAVNATYTPPTSTIGTYYYYIVVTNTNQTLDGIEPARVSVASNVAVVTVMGRDSSSSSDKDNDDDRGTGGSGSGQDNNEDKSLTLEVLINGEARLVALNSDGSIVLTADDIQNVSIPFVLQMPYALSSGENPNTVVAAILKGTDYEMIPMSRFDGEMVSMLISETGTYAVMNYEQSYVDVFGHWAADYIDFVSSRGLLVGIGENQFGPNEKMTRAMFVTVIARLSGADLLNVQTTGFDDVEANQWYSASLAWAANNGIVAGVGNSKFDPHSPITREQMAVMLNNYINYMNFNLQMADTAVPFEDDNQISSWAKEAVENMRKAGLMTGRGNNVFDPKADATRAEIATIFTNLINALVQ